VWESQAIESPVKESANFLKDANRTLAFLFSELYIMLMSPATPLKKEAK
jgi:hypothetical protein